MVLVVVALALVLVVPALAQKKGKEEQKGAESKKIEELIQEGEYQKALDLAKKFIEAGQVTEGLYIDMGVAYFNLKQYEEAIKAYEEAYQLNMFGTQALLYEATCYHEMGQDEKVAEVYEKVLGIEPTNTQVRYDLAQLYEKLKKLDPALAQYTEIYNVTPDFKDVAYAIAVILHNKGEMEKAEPYFDKAVSLAPANEDILLAQGQNFLKAKKYEPAVGPLAKYLEVAKNETLKPAVMRQIAGAYTKAAGAVKVDKKTMKPDELKAAQDKQSALYVNAITFYDKLLVVRPNNDEALEGKANALIQLGRNAEAVAVLKQFLQTSKNEEEKKKVSDLVKQLEAAKKG
jgi:superkiller protein 3